MVLGGKPSTVAISRIPQVVSSGSCSTIQVISWRALDSGSLRTRSASPSSAAGLAAPSSPALPVRPRSGPRSENVICDPPHLIVVEAALQRDALSLDGGEDHGDISVGDADAELSHFVAYRRGAGELPEDHLPALTDHLGCVGFRGERIPHQPGDHGPGLV